MEAAHEELFRCLAVIAQPVQRLSEYTRVDLVLNLPCDPKPFVIAHRNACHPWVRRQQVIYGDTGIRFPGKEFVLALYWKQKERADKTGFNLPALTESVRAEVQFKGKKAVRREIGGNVKTAVRQLDFFQCYRVFRRAWCLFDKDTPACIPTEKFSVHALIAECEAQGFRTSFGFSAWDWFCAKGQKPATISRLRPKVQAHKQSAMKFSWAGMLPENWWNTVVVDIHEDGTQEVVTHRASQAAPSTEALRPEAPAPGRRRRHEPQDVQRPCVARSDCGECNESAIGSAEARMAVNNPQAAAQAHQVLSS